MNVTEVERVGLPSLGVFERIVKIVESLYQISVQIFEKCVGLGESIENINIENIGDYFNDIYYDTVDKRKNLFKDMENALITLTTLFILNSSEVTAIKQYYDDTIFDTVDKRKNLFPDMENKINEIRTLVTLGLPEYQRTFFMCSVCSHNALIGPDCEEQPNAAGIYLDSEDPDKNVFFTADYAVVTPERNIICAIDGKASLDFEVDALFHVNNNMNLLRIAVWLQVDDIYMKPNGNTVRMPYVPCSMKIFDLSDRIAHIRYSAQFHVQKNEKLRICFMLLDMGDATRLLCYDSSKYDTKNLTKDGPGPGHQANGLTGPVNIVEYFCIDETYSYVNSNTTPVKRYIKSWDRNSRYAIQPKSDIVFRIN